MSHVRRGAQLFIHDFARNVPLYLAMLLIVAVVMLILATVWGAK